MKSKIKVLQLHDLFYASLPIKFKLWQLLLNFSQCITYTVTLMARRQVADLVIKMFLSTKSAISLHETNVRLICKGRERGGEGITGIGSVALALGWRQHQTLHVN